MLQKTILHSENLLQVNTRKHFTFKISVFFCVFFLMLFSLVSILLENSFANPSELNKDEVQQIEKEYKEYLSTVPQEVRNEIKEYRDKMLKINKEKIFLYDTLSQEAQIFLQKQEEFKKKLPLEGFKR